MNNDDKVGKMIEEYIAKHGVTKLPPDTRTEADLNNQPAPKKKRRTLRSVKRAKK